jgi:predicted DNA-binding helix-hairpin-helix protein
MRFYGFDVNEIIDEEHPFLDPLIDPKCNWALNHIDQFPAEINRVPYEMLLRIPGVGVRGAKRIMCARRERSLRFDDLRRLNVTLKRAKYFITCNGAFAEGVLFDPLSIHRELTRQARGRRFKGVLDGQMSLFEAGSGPGADVGSKVGPESALAGPLVARGYPQPALAQVSAARPALAPSSLGGTAS